MEAVGCVPPTRTGTNSTARHAPTSKRRCSSYAPVAGLRNENVSLTTTLITKLLTNPLAQSRSTADASDQSPASGPVHDTGRLSMAWKEPDAEPRPKSGPIARDWDHKPLA